MLEMLFGLFFGSGIIGFFSGSYAGTAADIDSMAVFVLAVMAAAGTLFIFLVTCFFKLLLVILNRE